jgi:hypothetical protein
VRKAGCSLKSRPLGLVGPQAGGRWLSGASRLMWLGHAEGICSPCPFPFDTGAHVGIGTHFGIVANASTSLVLLEQEAILIHRPRLLLGQVIRWILM